MTSLPAGWEADYDGTRNRWFYRYKASGLTQWTFPLPGDEFPQHFDPSSGPLVLEPEERLASERQLKRQETGGDGSSPSDGAGSEPSSGGRPGKKLEDGRKTQFGEHQMMATGYFDPESFMQQLSLGGDGSPDGDGSQRCGASTQQPPSELPAAGPSPLGHIPELVGSDMGKCAQELAPVELDASERPAELPTTHEGETVASSKGLFAPLRPPDLTPVEPTQSEFPTYQNECMETVPENDSTSNPAASNAKAGDDTRLSVQRLVFASRTRSDSEVHAWKPVNKLLENAAGISPGRPPRNSISGTTVLQSQDSELGWPATDKNRHRSVSDANLGTSVNRSPIPQVLQPALPVSTAAAAATTSFEPKSTNGNEGRTEGRGREDDSGFLSVSSRPSILAVGRARAGSDISARDLVHSSSSSTLSSAPSVLKPARHRMSNPPVPSQLPPVPGDGAPRVSSMATVYSQDEVHLSDPVENRPGSKSPPAADVGGYWPQQQKDVNPIGESFSQIAPLVLRSQTAELTNTGTSPSVYSSPSAYDQVSEVISLVETAQARYSLSSSTGRSLGPFSSAESTPTTVTVSDTTELSNASSTLVTDHYKADVVRQRQLSSASGQVSPPTIPGTPQTSPPSSSPKKVYPMLPGQIKPLPSQVDSIPVPPLSGEVVSRECSRSVSPARQLPQEESIIQGQEQQPVREQAQEPSANAHAYTHTPHHSDIVFELDPEPGLREQERTEHMQGDMEQQEAFLAQQRYDLQRKNTQKPPGPRRPGDPSDDSPPTFSTKGMKKWAKRIWPGSESSRRSEGSVTPPPGGFYLPVQVPGAPHQPQPTRHSQPHMSLPKAQLAPQTRSVSPSMNNQWPQDPASAYHSVGTSQSMGYAAQKQQQGYHNPHYQQPPRATPSPNSQIQRRPVAQPQQAQQYQQYQSPPSTASVVPQSVGAGTAPNPYGSQQNQTQPHYPPVQNHTPPPMHPASGQYATDSARKIHHKHTSSASHPRPLHQYQYQRQYQNPQYHNPEQQQRPQQPQYYQQAALGAKTAAPLADDAVSVVSADSNEMAYPTTGDNTAASAAATHGGPGYHHNQQQKQQQQYYYQYQNQQQPQPQPQHSQYHLHNRAAVSTDYSGGGWGEEWGAVREGGGHR